MSFGRAIIWLLPALALVLASCGGAASQGGSGATEVKVTLSEFKVDSSLTNFSVGVPYRFVVSNKGAIPHEVMVISTEVGKMASGAMMEEMHEKALFEIEESELGPGATKTLEFTFTEPAASGTLEFACYVPGHYEGGMKLPITVQ